MKCPAGFFCPSLSEQIECQLGEYCPMGSSMARECPKGSYCPNSTVHILCEGGTYCPDVNRTAEGITCPISYICPEGCITPTPCRSDQFCPVPGLPAVDRPLAMTDVQMLCPAGTQQTGGDSFFGCCQPKSAYSLNTPFPSPNGLMCEFVSSFDYGIVYFDPIQDPQCSLKDPQLCHGGGCAVLQAMAGQSPYYTRDQRAQSGRVGMHLPIWDRWRSVPVFVHPWLDRQSLCESCNSVSQRDGMSACGRKHYRCSRPQCCTCGSSCMPRRLLLPTGIDIPHRLPVRNSMYQRKSGTTRNLPSRIRLHVPFRADSGSQRHQQYCRSSR